VLRRRGLKAGDRITVRSAEEILATLDSSGTIDALPFMAEMLGYCGREFEVAAVAHKTCDTVHKTGGRRVADAIHLKDVRCDGAAHGGCQAGCLIFWKTSWLTKADTGEAATAGSAMPARLDTNDLRNLGSREEPDGRVYSCQATRLYDASGPLPWWDLRQYVADVWYGNVTIGRFLRVLTLRVLYHLRRLPFGYRVSVAVYDAAHRMLTGRASPYEAGLIPNGQPTPTRNLDLEVGEWVDVLPLDEIRRTITENNMNRGMLFDPEMARYCSGRFRVERRVDRLIDERTGRMLDMKSPCIVLQGTACPAEYSQLRLFCPRQIQPYFREIWLRRANATAASGGADGRVETVP
jgi:hypothetical protein